MHLQAVSLFIASFLVAAASAQHPHPPPCHVGHVWPDHHDCHSFFECAAGGHPVRKTCGPDTAYCWETGVCVHEEQVPVCHHKGPHGHPGGQGHPWPQGQGHHGGSPGGSEHGGPPAGNGQYGGGPGGW